MDKYDFPKKISENLEIVSMVNDTSFLVHFKNGKGTYSAKVFHFDTSDEKIKPPTDLTELNAFNEVKKELGL